MSATSTSSDSRPPRGSDANDTPRGAEKGEAQERTLQERTLRDVDRAIEELRRRRSQARAARQRVQSSTASTRAAPEEIDEELAAMDAEVAAAMTQLEADERRAEEASLEPDDVQKENVRRALPATTEVAKTEKNANPGSSPSLVRPPRARRAGARSVGPALGSGVFGAREASAAEAKAEVAAAKAEARASLGRRGDDGDATAAVTLWTRDVDAVLSKLDACDEVVRAKRAYFKERREQEEKET